MQIHNKRFCIFVFHRLLEQEVLRFDPVEGMEIVEEKSRFGYQRFRVRCPFYSDVNHDHHLCHTSRSVGARHIRPYGHIKIEVLPQVPATV